MRAMSTATTKPAGDEAAGPEDLSGRDGTLIGELTGESGEVIRCLMGRAAERAEQLVYASGPEGQAMCLGWVDERSARGEAEAIWADFRAADPAERWARPVTAAEAEELLPKGGCRAASVTGSGGGEEAGFLDGPALYEWMVASKVITVGRLRSQVGDSRARRLNGWRSGDQASVAVVDEILTGKGMHLQDVPAEVWKPRKRVRQASAEVRLEGGRRYLAGEPVAELAAEYGASTHTVRNWGRALQARGAAGSGPGRDASRVAA